MLPPWKASLSTRPYLFRQTLFWLVRCYSMCTNDFISQHFNSQQLSDSICTQWLCLFEGKQHEYLSCVRQRKKNSRWLWVYMSFHLGECVLALYIFFFFSYHRQHVIHKSLRWQPDNTPCYCQTTGLKEQVVQLWVCSVNCTLLNFLQYVH